MSYKLFGAVWCQPCQATKKTLTSRGIDFEFIDIDENREEAVANNIRSVPTMIDDQGNRAAGLEKILELIKNDTKGN